MKLLILACCLSISCYSFAQSWGAGFQKWLDDEHYVEIRKNGDNKETLKSTPKQVKQPLTKTYV